MTGYLLNGGDLQGLTYLQRNAILVMKQIRDRWLVENKAILATLG